MDILSSSNLTECYRSTDMCSMVCDFFQLFSTSYCNPERYKKSMHVLERLKVYVHTVLEGCGENIFIIFLFNHFICIYIIVKEKIQIECLCLILPCFITL